MFLNTAEPLATESTLKKGLGGIREILATSAIARHSKSPIENSLASLKQSTVTFNEKTMRWHDDQTKLMVKKTDSRVTEALKPKPSAVKKAVDSGMVTDKKVGLGVLAGYLKEIAESNSLIAKALTGTAEDKLEGKVADAKAAKEEKKQTGIFGGMLEALKKTAMGSWLLDNWKMIAATLFVLFAPLKWIKKLWGWATDFWDMPIWGKILTALGLIATYLLLKKGIATAVSAGVGMAQKGFQTFMQKRSAASMLTPAQKAMSAQRAGPGVLSRTGTVIKTGAVRAIEGGKAMAGKAVEGLKSAGGAVKKGAGNIASASKGIFSSLVEKFGKAGKWIMKLGSKLIMPLVTTPVGWAILAGLAIGGLVYTFWDEIKAGLKTALGMMTAAIDKVKNMFSGLNILDGLKSLLPNWLINMIGPSKKTKADKEHEKNKEGTTSKQKTLLNLIKQQEDKLEGGDTHRGLDAPGMMQGKSRKNIVTDLKKRLADTGYVAPKTAPAPTETKTSTTTKGGKTTTTETTGTTIRPDAVATKRLAQYRKNPSRWKEKMKSGLEGSYGDAIRSQMTSKELKRFGGGEDKHKAVKVSGADMSGVSWNKLGGKDTIEDAILTTWNQAGVSGAPTFTSGLRKKDAKESLANPRSQHIQGTAFDLRSKDLGSKGSTVFADIKEKFAGMGLWGQWERGSVNEGKRTGEHFHFQLASRGFNGIVGKDGPRGFIAGEAGEELVRIQPLVSPDDKMNAMNALNAENQTVRGQSGSPTIINTTNAQATTTNQTGGVFTLPNLVSAPKLTTSLPS